MTRSVEVEVESDAEDASLALAADEDELADEVCDTSLVGALDDEVTDEEWACRAFHPARSRRDAPAAAREPRVMYARRDAFVCVADALWA